jgi:hypothetical protein
LCFVYTETRKSNNNASNIISGGSSACIYKRKKKHIKDSRSECKICSTNYLIALCVVTWPIYCGKSRRATKFDIQIFTSVCSSNFGFCFVVVSRMFNDWYVSNFILKLFQIMFCSVNARYCATCVNWTRLTWICVTSLFLENC